MKGKHTAIGPRSILIDKGKTRFVLFMDGDLLFSIYNNRFEIHQDDRKQLTVYTGRSRKGLSDIVKLIP